MQTRPLDSDTLGKKGEARFDELCADAGLIANPATHDRAGWDFTVDFRLPENAASLDARPVPATVRVQVKTHWMDRDEISLRLSSAEHLVKYSGPSFICVLSVDPTTLEFTSMRLIHCRGAFVERVLRKLREAEKSGKRPNRVTLRVKPSEYSDPLAPHHQTLKGAFADIVAVDAVAYFSEKDSELKTVGFHGPRLTVNTTLAGRPEEIADAFLGRGDLEVGSFDMLETRFGITLPVQDGPAGPGRISFKPHPDPCTVRLTDGTQTFTLRGRVYRPPALVVNATGVPKVRVETELFELAMTIKSSPPKGTVEIEMSTLESRCQKRMAAHDWCRFYSLLDRTGTEGIRVEFSGADMDDLQFDLKFDFPDSGMKWRHLAKLAGEAEHVFAQTSLPNRKLTLAELWDARDDILKLGAMVQRPETVTGVEFLTKDLASLPDAESVRGLLGHTFKVGRSTMGLVLSLNMQRELRDGMLRWTSGAPELLGFRWVSSAKDYYRFLSEQPQHALRVLTGVHTRNTLV